MRESAVERVWHTYEVKATFWPWLSERILRTVKGVPCLLGSKTYQTTRTTQGGPWPFVQYWFHGHVHDVYGN